jgi:hypothetical protein
LVAAAVTGIGALGARPAILAGPTVLELLFGPHLLVPATDLALMVLAVCAQIGLVVLTQALVATRRHRSAGFTWLVAVAVAAAVFAVVDPLLLRVELALLIGSLVGAVVAGLALAAEWEEEAWHGRTW